MKKKLIFGLLLTVGLFLGVNKVSQAYSSIYHMEFRVYSPHDFTLIQKKKTKSAKLMNVTSMSNKLKSFTAYSTVYTYNTWADGMQYVDTSHGYTYTMYEGSNKALTNYAVEDYGKNINTAIGVKRWASGSSAGTWQADR